MIFLKGSDPKGIAGSILKTLKYSDHFGFPLTFEEIYLRLVGTKSSRDSLIRTVNQMYEQKQIEKSGEYYHLLGRKGLVASRTQRQLVSAQLLSQAKIISKQLGKVIGVQSVFLTGSLAMSNCDENADIDLMIITKNNRLWTTRALLTIYVEILGLRRRPGSQKSSGKICLNLYLSPKSYSLPESKRSLYTAYELIQATPLFDPHDTRSDLLLSNSWIYSYLPNAPKGSDLVPRTVSPGSDLEGRAQPAVTKAGRSDPKGVDIIEFLCFHLQFFYMRKKITREYITPNSAFFHPSNPGEKVLKKLKV